MAGKSPSIAFDNYIDPLNKALNCVADGCLSLSKESAQSRLVTDFDLAVTLRGAEAVRLGDGSPPLWLGIRQAFLIVKTDGERGPYKVRTIAYSYRFHVELDDARKEIIAFQWNREADWPLRKYPHLHIGSAVAQGSLYRRTDFNDLHIPTGRLSLEAVLIFAIKELGVSPIQGQSQTDPLDTLREGDQVFRRWSTEDGDWY